MQVRPGQSFPLGATIMDGGVNFSVFAHRCERIQLLLFDRGDDAHPSAIIELDPRINRTFKYWHIFVAGLKEGQLYGYRVYGPWNLAKGYMFDGEKLLIDPYAKAVAHNPNYSRAAACVKGDNIDKALKSVVVSDDFDWEGDVHPMHSYTKSFIYELHVKGFTAHPNSGLKEELRGTYLGLIEKIPYLKELGVTAVELMPVQQFDYQHAPPGLPNYWGYSQLAFFAPHNQYAVGKNPLDPVREFKQMVKALHHAGIEVILDVVFNHTAEEGLNGPILSWRGFSNRTYYMLTPNEEGVKDFHNFSGVGNAIRGDHSIVRNMIMDCLRYWVTEMHVDGFRFDLASVLARDSYGTPMKNPPLLWDIENDPVLAGTKIIAEAWDAAGLYQLGSFIGDKWAEWNGKFRDDIRRFIKGDPGMVSTVVNRIGGSADLFRDEERNPLRSINFVSCHDGFTLNDVVSYNEKHNEANLEDNRDGANDNYSWNCGIEGPTDDEEIEALRLRQIKNMMAILAFSHGCPMICMGDEVRRTQLGNNNAYCQDNEISWFDWDLVQKNDGLRRFVSIVRRPLLGSGFLHEEELERWIINNPDGGINVRFHGLKLDNPDTTYHSNTLAYSLQRNGGPEFFHLMMNAFWEPLTFEIPSLRGHAMEWHRWMDTFLPAPDDIMELDQLVEFGGEVVKGKSYVVQPRSMVALISRPKI